MKSIETKQMPLPEKFHNFCVELSTHVVLGGGVSFKQLGSEAAKCLKGFTLAEVLVTLGIIGVVSAMTVPTLMQNHQRKTYVTQLHKVYNEFQQASRRQITSRNALNLIESGVRSDADMGNFLKSQFKVIQDCTGSPSDCFADSYKNMNGAAVTAYSDAAAPCFVLASGAAICTKYNVSKLLFETGNSSIVNPSRPSTNPNYIQGLVGDLIVDINAKKGPNVVGRDIFVAGIYTDGSIKTALPGLKLVQPEDEIKTSLQKCQSATALARQSDASYCFAEIFSNNWEMNY